MAHRKLPNYLLTHRKHGGSTQPEMAFLLGCKSPTKVSLYERYARLPNLKTALTYQALFGAPVAELFAGIYEQIEKEAANRAKILAQKIQGYKADKTTERKLELLRAIAVTPDINKENP